jgi:membrane-associated phospholipid phosphatase
MDARPRRDGDLVRDPRIVGAAAAAMLAAVTLMALLVAADVARPPLLHGPDTWWRDLIEPAETWEERLGEWLYVAGSGFVMVPIRVGVAIWLIARRRWVDLGAWLAAWAISDLITQLLKPGLARMRPDLSNASSFPSGHAKTAAQVSIGLVLVATSPWRSRAAAWTIAIAWTALMALSRTWLMDHYLSDVVAGSLLGAGCTLGAAAVAQRLRDRRAASG